MTTPTQELEQEIKACGADVAPRITPDMIEANIASEDYFTAGQAIGLSHVEGIDYVPPREVHSLDLLTFCVLVLRNGFTVTGESACASPENFNAEIGRKIARANAISKVWPLMGYALKEKTVRLMPTVTLHIGAQGKLEGLSERDRKGYAKFRRRLDELGDGSISFSWKEPRSGPYHRRFFSIFNALFERQEQFHLEEHLLTWLKVGADYADLVPGPKGKPVAIARSINWETIDQAEFEQIASDIWNFLRSTYASRFLWPHLDDDVAAGMVESILASYGE